MNIVAFRHILIIIFVTSVGIYGSLVIARTDVRNERLLAMIAVMVSWITLASVVR
jgi:hypothetical protein